MSLDKPAPNLTPPMDPRWALLAAPFRDDEIETLPKPYKRDAPKGTCQECGGYHGLPAAHLSYVGHAGVTMRLNEVDPTWNWEPMALTPAGTPLWSDGGLWIRLTVLGVTRLGFGDAAGKTGPNATKEIIGDALRNAAMRFGVGTYLWSKSEASKAVAARQGEDVDEPQAPSTGSSTGQSTGQEQPQGPVNPAAYARFLSAYNAMDEAEQGHVKEWVQAERLGVPFEFTEEIVNLVLDEVTGVMARPAPADPT